MNKFYLIIVGLAFVALVIIFGMTVGTFVSLFYVPAVYSAIYRRRR